MLFLIFDLLLKNSCMYFKVFLFKISTIKAILELPIKNNILHYT